MGAAESPSPVVFSLVYVAVLGVLLGLLLSSVLGMT